jgi:hypothetical protein
MVLLELLSANCEDILDIPFLSDEACLNLSAYLGFPFLSPFCFLPVKAVAQ